jgi:hypothetical protein
MPLSKRFNKHKHHKTGAYMYFSVVGWEKAKIVLVETYPCNSRDELRAREEYWRVELGATLNKNAAYASEERRVQVYLKYKEDNKEKLRLYREENKEVQNEKKRIYRKENPEKIKEERRRYQEENKEVINEQKRNRRKVSEDFRSKESEYNRKYKEENKERIAARSAEKVLCPHCDLEVTRGCLTKHIKRKHTEKIR